MNLNKISKALCVTLAVIGIFALLGIAGRQDYNQEVLYTMPQEAYEQIVLDLGDDATDNDIVSTYMNNKAYYDKLSKWQLICVPLEQ